MNTQTHPSFLIATHRRRAALAGACVNLAATLLAGSALAAGTNLTWKADIALKETYDDNVFLQNHAPTASMPDAVPANKSSWVTTITPRVGLDAQVCPDFKASLSYAPDIAFYHNAPSENNTTHRGVTTFSGKTDDVIWEQTDTFTYIDGSRYGPVFGRTAAGSSQDVPAVGGIPLRDRRAAFIYKGGFKLTWTVDKFFIRPVASAYVHDFLTVQKLSMPVAGECYENYLDRQDVNGGLDVGYDVGKKTYLILGYRYGQQDQFVGPGASNSKIFTDSPYDSAYHRILLGIEGSPAKWLKLAALGGPEFRSWADGTPANFDRNRLVYWVDASATLLPDKSNTMTLLFRRYQQPAFASQSVYDDITYSATWKHTFNGHFSASVGIQLYIGEWLAPVNRDDWIYTPSAALTYTCNKHFSVEAACSGDWARNETPTSAPGAAYADGREFTRHLVSLAAKYAF